MSSTYTQTTFSNLSDLLGYLLTYFLVNLLIILATTVLFPSQLVLGNDLVTPLMALIQASFLSSFFVVALVPVVEVFISQLKYQVSSRDWFAIFVVINVMVVWGLSRLAQVVGMGIASWAVALILGMILSLLQGWTVKNLLRSA